MTIEISKRSFIFGTFKTETIETVEKAWEHKRVGSIGFFSQDQIFSPTRIGKMVTYYSKDDINKNQKHVTHLASNIFHRIMGEKIIIKYLPHNPTEKQIK
jgi:hypothetical protein